MSERLGLGLYRLLLRLLPAEFRERHAGEMERMPSIDPVVRR
jgi:hypothetical protein